MDGSLSAGAYRSSSLDSLRADSLRFDAQRGDSLGSDARASVHVSGGLSSSSVHGNLFEQILSLPAPISVDRYSEPVDTHSTEAPEDYVEPTLKSDSASEDSSSESEDESRESEDSAASAVANEAQIANQPDLVPEVVEVQTQATPDEAAPIAGDPEVTSEGQDVKTVNTSAPESSSEQNANKLQLQANENVTSADASTEATDQVVDNQAQAASEQVPQESRTDAVQAQNDVNNSSADAAIESQGIQKQRETTEGQASQSPETPTAREVVQTNDREGRTRDGREEQGKWYEKNTANTPDTTAPDESYAEKLTPIQTEQRQSNEQPLPTAEQVPAANLDESPPTPEQALATISTTVSNRTPESAALSTTKTLDGEMPTIAAGSSNGKVERSATRDAGKAAQSNQASSPDELTQHERIRLVQRVARSFARLGPTGGQINLRLHPPQLGSLNVQVRLEGRSMTAKLTTESSAARDAILESLPVLRGRLAEQGYEVSQFQVEVADNNADANFGQSNEQATQDSRRDGQTSRVDYRRLALGREQTNEDLPSNPNPTLVWQATAGIDIHA